MTDIEHKAVIDAVSALDDKHAKTALMVDFRRKIDEGVVRWEAFQIVERVISESGDSIAFDTAMAIEKALRGAGYDFVKVAP